MNDDLSNKTVLILDNGLFISLAHVLAKKFGIVKYHTPWIEAFPTLTRASVGHGFGDIERCDQPWLEEPDLVLVPDLYFADAQLEWERRGVPVWGARTGEEYELDRELFLAALRESGLDVPPHVVVEGWSKLAEELHEREDCFVKLSRWRGTMETSHWRSWELDNDWLYSLAIKLGPLKEQVRFIVCEKIDTDVELGGDTFCINGQWPDLMLHGTEAKDKAYLAAVTEGEQMPEELQAIMQAFGPLLGDQGYCNQFSMEVRVTKDKAYFIDATTRASSPGSASQWTLWENFAEIVWAGAHGELVQPEPAAKFSMEVACSLKSDRNGWGSIELPEELKDWLFPANCCEHEGRIWFPPDPTVHGEFFGWLLAIGDTPRETLNRLQERLALLPEGMSAAIEPMAEVIREIEAEEEAGIDFSEKTIPEPQEVIREED